MNPLSPFQTAKPPPPSFTPSQAGCAVFIICILLGIGGVIWRASLRADAGRTSARQEAAYWASGVEAQLRQVISAAEIVGAVGRQSGGSVPDFQRVGSAVLATRPGLASIEMQPNGVVSDIVPKAGQERALGVKTLQDPVQRMLAAEAVQRRAPVLGGPVALHRGGRGVVARVPVFNQTRDGREVLWGFMAASMGVETLVRQAGLGEAERRGYRYLLYIPPAGPQKAVTLVSSGGAFVSPVQLPLKVGNFELRLALQPAGGWGSKIWLMLDGLGALLGSGLLGWAAFMWFGQRRLETELDRAKEETRRERDLHAQVADEAKSAKEALTTAQAELISVRGLLEAAQGANTEMEARLDQSRREIVHTTQLVQDKVEELGEAQGALRDAQQKLRDAEVQLEKQTIEFETLRSQAEARASGDQVLIQELKANLESAAKQGEANTRVLAARIVELEERCSDLQGRLRSAQKAEIRVAELTLLLEKTETELSSERQKVAAAVEDADPEGILPGGGSSGESEEAGAMREATPANELGVGETASHPEPETSSSFGAPEIVEETSPKEETLVTEPVDPAAERVPTAVGVGTSESESESTSEQAGTPLDSGTPAEAMNPTTEKQSKTPRRRKIKRDDQMDLFGGQEEPELPRVVAEKIEETLVAKPEEDRSEVAATPELPVEAGGDAGTSTGEQSRHVPMAKDSEAGIDVFVRTEKSEANKPEFPAIEGLATSEGLAWANGNTKVYLKALQKFEEQQSGVPEKVRDALVQGDNEEAESLVSHLAGVAGDLGALAVRDAAVVLARAIHSPADPTSIETQWSRLEKELDDLVVNLKPHLPQRELKAAPAARRLPAAAALDLAELRKAVGIIVPLLVDGDPGAKDCLKDNKGTFRSGFAAETYVDFEHAVRSSKFEVALELLKKAVRKHAINI